MYIYFTNGIEAGSVKRNKMNIEIKEATERFVSYIKMGWQTEESFEIAYDSVYDIIEKEPFLNLCQIACREKKQSINN